MRSLMRSLMRSSSLPRLWGSLYGALLANATSVVGTTVVTSGLGYLF